MVQITYLAYNTKLFPQPFNVQICEGNPIHQYLHNLKTFQTLLYKNIRLDYKQSKLNALDKLQTALNRAISVGGILMQATLIVKSVWKYVG